MDAILEKYAKFANTIHYKIFEYIDQLNIDMHMTWLQICGQILGYDIIIIFSNRTLEYKINNQDGKFMNDSRHINLRSCAKLIFSILNRGIFREHCTDFYYDLSGNCLAKMLISSKDGATYGKLPGMDYEILLTNPNHAQIEHLEKIIILHSDNYDNIALMPNLLYVINGKDYTGTHKHYRINNPFDSWELALKLLRQYHHQKIKSAKKLD